MWENTLAFLEQEEISSRTKNTKQLHNHKESINNTNRYAVKILEFIQSHMCTTSLKKTNTVSKIKTEK